MLYEVLTGLAVFQFPHIIPVLLFHLAAITQNPYSKKEKRRADAGRSARVGRRDRGERARADRTHGARA